MIKMIFSDMDGTLLDEQGQLPDGFDSVARCLRERGVMFAPCSGRQYFSLLDTFRDYREEFLFLAETVRWSGTGERSFFPARWTMVWACR